MIPHIVFATGWTLLPRPARWACSALAAHAPRHRHTSGITQPPVHAIAVQRILDRARTRGRSTRAVAGRSSTGAGPDLVRLYRWLAEARDQQGHGRITLYHGWESGMDNSPRWDAPYANVIPATSRSTSARTTASSPIPASAPPTASTTGTCGCWRR